ncbi:MAG: Hsp70 family protein, partial [bacterium]
DPMALQRLKEAAEKAKCELSGTLSTDVNLPFITADQNGPKHLNVTLSRAKLEQIVAPLIERCRGPVLQALKDAGLTPAQIDEVVLVGGSTRMPRVQELVKEIFGKEPHKGVNPDEVVAIGAAIQGAVLSGEVKDVVLLDVTPLSLGIETLGGVMTPLITRNTTIPTRKSETFSTAADAQPTVEVHVMQGERPMVSGNKSLGRFHLDGIRPAPRGTPKIEVTFDIDANGILHVSARDQDTGKEQSIRIEASSGLKDDEIQRMVDDAASHAEEDQRLKALAEARNSGEAKAYEVEKGISEHGEKLDEATKSSLQDGIKTVRDAVKGDDVRAIETAADTLAKAWMAAAQSLYQQAPPPGPGATPGAESAEPPKRKGDGAVDADFEVMN